MGAAASATDMMDTIPESKKDLKSFLSPFVILAEPGEKGKILRKKEWASVDQNGSAIVSLTECQSWIRHKLCAQHGANTDNYGSYLWSLYKPSYILAFHDAADAQGTGYAEYVTSREFRLLVAYICFYAAMLDWFASIDGGNDGVKKEDDTRISLEEWEAWFAKKEGLEDYSFAVMEKIKSNTCGAKDFFQEMDLNGLGKVLLKEWCLYIKQHEIEAQTQVGKWLDAGDKNITRNIISRAASSKLENIELHGKKPNVKEDLNLFIKFFAPIAAQDEKGKSLRKNEWLRLDQNGSRKVSLAECWRWIRNKLIDELKDTDEGTRLWKIYRPSYILAFNDAASVHDDNDDNYVTAKEFRLLAAYICFYAAIFDWFALIDGGDSGVTKNDDRRISLGEWERWFINKEGVDEYRFEFTNLIRNEETEAKQFFLEMDANKGGMVLLKEFCVYVKKIEIEGGTDVGKWISYAKDGTL